MDTESGKTILAPTGDHLSPTVTHDQHFSVNQCGELIKSYESIHEADLLSWTTHLQLRRRLGSGGQGVVYLTGRRGADTFSLPVALKVFSPEHYATPSDYDADMTRMARVAAKVARIQHESLLVVENFLDRDRIRMMVMEWVEGFDLRKLLTPKMFGIMKERVSEKRWEYINEVLITAGPVQPRVKPGVAISIIRNCLEALAALHRNGIVHGDVKPGNIMLKRSGHAKMIDIGSAFDVDNPPTRSACTPAYAALEVLEKRANTPLSDLASVGYVTIELLSGVPPFEGINDLKELIESKKNLPDRLEGIMPEEVACNDLLMSFCRGLIAADPGKRFPSAEAADLLEEGASGFHRQLVKNDMASEYENDLRIWIDELLELNLDEDDFGTART